MKRPTPAIIRSSILQIAFERGPDKTLCPSEVARQLTAGTDTDPQTLMPAIRSAAAALWDQGKIRVLQKGQIVGINHVRGPIRLQIHKDPRPDRMPIDQIYNLGDVSRQHLASVGIHTLGELRRVGALAAFESVMVHQMNLGVRRNLFHSMYLYALWSALHDVSCMQLPGSVKEQLKAMAAACKESLLGKPD